MQVLHPIKGSSHFIRKYLDCGGCIALLDYVHERCNNILGLRQCRFCNVEYTYKKSYELGLCVRQ